ncbi:MAG: hypothetical protein KDD22_02345 [Bdellovibrionales bacterium]|nr:hypothetical protein [Bdellovibrionales bacterium]
MSRELNQNLFNTPPRRSSSTASATGIEKPIGTVKPSTESVHLEEYQLLMHNFEAMKRKMKDLEFKIEGMSSRMTEIASALKARIERTAGVSHRVEEIAKIGLQDMAQKHAQLTSKIAERRVNDTKVEELVDRHNQVLNQFEVRMGQMQRVISEQEMQLLNSRSALQEALKEIARLTGR